MCRDAQCGQGKYSSSCHMSLSPIVSLTNIINVYEALGGVYIGKGGMIMPMTKTCDSNTLVLALATLGGTT
jgi:hypothetical protein